MAANKAYSYTVNEKLVVDGIPVWEYFNTYVMPRNKKFRQIGPERPHTLCPFHDDTDPSFGIWKGKPLCHCFGCGITVDVIRMHQNIVARYDNRAISEELAVKELANMYDITLEVDEQGEMVAENAFTRARKLMAVDATQVGKLGSMENMSVATFRMYNNQIRGQITEYMDVTQLSKMYARLDDMLSASLAERKEANV